MTDQFELPKPFATWKEDDDDCGAWGQADRPVFTAEQMRWAYQQGQLSRAIPEGHVVVPGWLPIESAPKGSGLGKLTTDPDYVAPPSILLLFEEGKIAVGYWDWYYAEGGRGYEGGLAWIAQEAGERLDLHYDAPIGWMPLPAAPANKEG